MQHILLIGAGFSRNWGGWLANEAFEYLLGASQVDQYIKEILWSAKLRGEGFEGALSALQGAYAANASEQNKRRLDALTEAVVGMFSDMQSAFDRLQLSNGALELQRFLAKFDAIISLNQDTFLETHYAGEVRWSERWYGSYLPHMKLVEPPAEPYRFMLRAPMTPDMSLATKENYQPIYKLHGSYNWLSKPDGERLVVMGGSKVASIERFPILARYQSVFRAMLNEPNTHLMIIGYSFGDSHINSVIESAAQNGLKIFVIDPNGVDVVDKRDARAQIPQPTTDLMNVLMPRFFGASRRTLNEILITDLVENGKVMRFFDEQTYIVRMERSH